MSKKLILSCYEDDQCRLDLEERVVDFDLDAVKLAVSNLFSEYDDYCCSIDITYELSQGDLHGYLWESSDIDKEFDELSKDVELVETISDAFGQDFKINGSHIFITIANRRFIIMNHERSDGVFVNDFYSSDRKYSKVMQLNEVVPYLSNIK